MNLTFNIRWLSAGVPFAIAVALFASVCLGAEPVSLAKKNIPAITLKNLSPPYLDYRYFQNSSAVPFEFEAAFFSLVNAWWLAEASTLVYADEPFVRRRFTEAGLDRVAFFDRSGTQCFIASNSRFAIVAFRGSEFWKRSGRFDPRQMLADFWTDIDIRLSDWSRGARVHSGFKSAIDGVWNDILPEIKRLQDRNVPIWMTGHSLGAALATLAADRLQDVQGLYTFGSPRVGDQKFKTGFAPKAYRVVNGSDFVAAIPPKGTYLHVGSAVFIDENTGIRFGNRSTAEAGDAPCDAASIDSAATKDIQRADSAFYIPGPIRDHVPLLYSVFLWNELVEMPGWCNSE